jgi:hypothetical protein
MDPGPSSKVALSVASLLFLYEELKWPRDEKVQLPSNRFQKVAIALEDHNLCEKGLYQ